MRGIGRVSSFCLFSFVPVEPQRTRRVCPNSPTRGNPGRCTSKANSLQAGTWRSDTSLDPGSEGTVFLLAKIKKQPATRQLEVLVW